MNWTLQKLKVALDSGQLALKRLLSHQEEKGPDPIYTTTCRVYTLWDGDQLVGYYKEEKHGLYGCAIMSQIVWDTANILGIEENLIQCEQMPPFSVEGISYQGGLVQLKQDGITFSEYWDHPDKRQALITPDQLIESLFVTLILGMFDLHRSNIIIAPDGSPKFFDLTCSLPHSNHFLDRGGYLKSPYHCELLFLEYHSHLISIEKRKSIQKRLERIQKKLGDVKTLLDQSIEKRLPDHWLHPNLAYNALKERIQAMLYSLQNNQVIQIRDLVFRTIPEYKFICFLNYCILLDWRMLAKNPTLLPRCLGDIEKPIFFDLLPVSIESMVDECVNMGLDPQKIEKCCHKGSLSQTMSCIVHYAQELIEYMDNPIEENFRKQQALFLIKSMKEKSEIDYKDWGENLKV